MKKTITAIFVFLLAFLSISSYNISQAGKEIKEIQDVPGSYNDAKKGYKVLDPDEYNPLKIDISSEDKKIIRNKASIILGWLRNISAIVSVIAIMVVGLKYIIGSVEEKAKYKETLIPIVIGCIMITSGSTLISFIYDNFIYKR